MLRVAQGSPPDLQVPPEKQERWAWQREIREVTKEVKEIARGCRTSFFHESHGLMEGHGRRAAGGRPTS